MFSIFGHHNHSIMSTVLAICISVHHPQYAPILPPPLPSLFGRSLPIPSQLFPSSSLPLIPPPPPLSPPPCLHTRLTPNIKQAIMPNTITPNTLRLLRPKLPAINSDLQVTRIINNQSAKLFLDYTYNRTLLLRSLT